MPSTYHLKRKLQKELLMSQRASELVQAGLPGGKVFWVASGGSNDNDGSPDYPFLTITYALSKCTAGNEDTIYINSDYWQATGETWPISVNKTNVHIKGVNYGPTGYGPTIKPTGDTAAFDMVSAGAGSEICNLALAGGATAACIELEGTGHFWIHDCMFGNADNGAGAYGILSTQGTVNAECVIEDNVFHGDLANVPGKLTENGIQAIGTNLFRHTIIRRNYFLGLAVGINLGSAAGLSILDNKFVCADSGDGEAIALATGARGCMVDGNVVMNGGDAAMTQQPYVDVAATNKNHWGVNWTSNAVDLPKQTA